MAAIICDGGKSVFRVVFVIIDGVPDNTQYCLLRYFSRQCPSFSHASLAILSASPAMEATEMQRYGRESKLSDEKCVCLNILFAHYICY